MARVVEKRFAFEPDDKEQFRIYMRMKGHFSGAGGDGWSRRELDGRKGVR